MSDQLSKLLIITLVLLALLFLWILSIGVTFWDVSRRRLPGGETAAWMALVVLVPGVGFGAYLFSRLLGVFLAPGSPPAEAPRKRVTLVERPPQQAPAPRTGTIPAADLVQTTLPEMSPLRQTAAVLDQRRFPLKLAVLEGPHIGREYRLDSLPVSIGRGPESAVRLDDDLGVSRQHAEIYEQAGVLRIRDLKSTHGTHVNGFSIDDKSLEPGDRIRVGLSTLVVNLEEQA